MRSWMIIKSLRIYWGHSWSQPERFLFHWYDWSLPGPVFVEWLSPLPLKIDCIHQKRSEITIKHVRKENRFDGLFGFLCHITIDYLCCIIRLLEFNRLNISWKLLHSHFPRPIFPLILVAPKFYWQSSARIFQRFVWTNSK